MDMSLCCIMASVFCAALFLLAYRSLKAPFFLFMLAAMIFAVSASATAAFRPDPAAGALYDIFLMLCGASTAAASLQLSYSFRLAGDMP